MKATITECDGCGIIAAAITPEAVRSRTVPGTGDRGAWNCGHSTRTLIGRVDVERLAHVTLSTLMRSGHLDDGQRDMAHVLQEWLSVPRPDSRLDMPARILAGYGVNDTGVALCRHISSMVARIANPGRDVLYWRALASITRRRINDK